MVARTAVARAVAPGAVAPGAVATRVQQLALRGGPAVSKAASSRLETQQVQL